jgi:prevent-host-death family protein
MRSLDRWTSNYHPQGLLQHQARFDDFASALRRISSNPTERLKAHVSEIVRDLGNTGASLFITQNGEAKAVLQDIHSYEQTQEALAMLKILALGQTQIAEGKVKPLDEAIRAIKAKRRSSE